MAFQGVKFEDEDTHYRSRAVLGESMTPKMITWVMRVGSNFIKDERQAAYILLVAIIIILLVLLAI